MEQEGWKRRKKKQRNRSRCIRRIVRKSNWRWRWGEEEKKEEE